MVERRVSMAAMVQLAEGNGAEWIVSTTSFDAKSHEGGRTDAFAS